MVFKKRVQICGARKWFFFYIDLFGAILFSFLFLNVALAEVNANTDDTINTSTAIKISPTNEESMSVVLTQDDIQPAVSMDAIIEYTKEAPQDKAQNDKKEDGNSDKKTDTDEKSHDENAQQNQNEPKQAISIPVGTQDEFKQTLPQVISQTQHIGTPEQPTIDGGLISAPELVGVLSATAENMMSDGSFNEMQTFIFMKLNQVYFLWEGLKQYDLESSDLYRGLSRLKLTHENYKNKLGMKCAQILTYWTTPRARHTSHRPHKVVKAHKSSSSNRKKTKGVHLAQLSEQPDFKEGYHGNN